MIRTCAGAGAIEDSGFSRLAAEREGRQCLGAEVDGQDLQRRQRHGTAPPERAKIRNGTTSGVAWAKMQVTNLRMFS
jgi:hypothetical protein